MKIMTYNIMQGFNYVKRCLEGDKTPDVTDSHIFANAEIIHRQNPDVVVLNEVNGIGGVFNVAQANKLAEICGFDFVYFAPAIIRDNGRPYGNAIISKYPISFSQTILVKTRDVSVSRCEDRSIAHVTIDVCGKKLDVIGTHFGLLQTEKQDMLDNIITLVKKIQNPLVLMGDFNCMPSTDYSKILREYLIDTMYDYGDNYTTYFGHAQKHCCKKIDYIYVSNNVTYSNAKVVTESVSDHFPCIATIEF